LPERVAAFAISGGGSSGWRRFVATHPPLAERIDALRAAHVAQPAMRRQLES
jgi:heat shock protein HtpX